MRCAPVLLLACLLASHPLARGALEAPPATTDPAQPHRSSDLVKKALAAVIEGQLAAFRANDYAKAYTFAAAEIQAMFTLAQFEEMVKSSYPVIAHSTNADFGLAIDTGDEAVVTVRVENAGGQNAAYQYHLTRQNGAWRIGGVSEVAARGLTV